MSKTYSRTYYINYDTTVYNSKKLFFFIILRIHGKWYFSNFNLTAIDIK
jgi:hypothetical protein